MLPDKLCADLGTSFFSVPPTPIGVHIYEGVLARQGASVPGLGCDAKKEDAPADVSATFLVPPASFERVVTVSSCPTTDINPALQTVLNIFQATGAQQQQQQPGHQFTCISAEASFLVLVIGCMSTTT